jgi:peptidyl-prolyl cis-trans isomerase B (cyclophilin B)
MPLERPARVLAAAVLAVLAALLIAACGNDGEGEATSASLPEGCEEAQEPPPKRAKLKGPRRTLGGSQSLVATVDTSCGSFEIALDTRDSPKTVSSFVYLARQGFYDDTTIHRIVPGFVIQGGDQLGTGRGGPGYSVDEPPPSDTEYTRATVAMAKTAFEPPGRSGSQFFIVRAADAGLPPDYALLGQVSSGEDVLDRISKLGDPASGDSGTPLATVVIRTITISEG